MDGIEWKWDNGKEIHSFYYEWLCIWWDGKDEIVQKGEKKCEERKEKKIMEDRREEKSWRIV